MSLVPSQKGALLESANDRHHFMLLCQWIAGICCYVFWLSTIYLLTDSSLLWSDELRVAMGISVGFAQLTMTGFWLAFASHFRNVTFGIVAVALESLAVLFFSNLAAHFIPPSFFVATTLACGLQFVMVFGAGKIANKVFHWSLTCSYSTMVGSNPRAQFRIRDLLIAMAAIAFLVSFLQSKRSELGSISGALTYFGLIVGYFNLMCWPCIFACLCRFHWTNVAIAMPVVAGLILSQKSVFSFAFKSSGDSWLFFICLDLPFLTCLTVHALVARHFGYRLK